MIFSLRLGFTTGASSCNTPSHLKPWVMTKKLRKQKECSFAIPISQPNITNTSHGIHYLSQHDRQERGACDKTLSSLSKAPHRLLGNRRYRIDRRYPRHHPGFHERNTRRAS